MSWGSKDSMPREEKKPLGLDENKISTNEAGITLPVLYGQDLLSTIHIGKPYNVKTKAIKKRVGGKFGKNETIGYEYSCDFASLVCCGVVGEIKSIKLDDQEAWSGSLLQVDDDPGIITLDDDRGTVKIYWGTDNQSTNGTLLEKGHTAMLNVCYLFFDNFILGVDRTNVPNIQVEVIRNPVIPGVSITPEVSGDECNIALIPLDLWTNTFYGLGNPLSTVDVTSFELAAPEFSNNDLGVSATIFESKDILEIFSEISQYCDCSFRFDSQNRLQIKPLRPSTSPGTTPLFDESHMIEEPVINSGSWNDTFSVTRIKYKNRINNYINETEMYSNPGNFAITGEYREQTLDRPWIKRQELANRYAVLKGDDLSVPKITGEIKIKKSSLGTLDVGDWFRISYDDWGISQFLCLCQEISYDDTRSQSVTLIFKVNILNINTDPPSDDPAIGEDIYDVGLLADPRVLEPEYGLTNSDSTSLIALGSRTGEIDVGFFVHKSSDDSSYEAISKQIFFCTTGTLDDNYSEDTLYYDEIGFDITITSTIDTILLNTSYEEGVSGKYIGFINDEIISIIDATLIDAGPPLRYNLKCLRRQFGSQQKSHSINDIIYIIERDSLPVFSNVNYLLGELYYHKLQPFTIGGSYDLSLISSSSLTFQAKHKRPPAPVNLKLNGELTNSIYSTGQNIDCDWDQTSWDQISDFLDDPDWNDSLISYELDFLTIADVLKRTESIASGTNSYTYSNANLISDFGSEVNLKIRAFQIKNGLRSIYFEEKIITKV